jgi:hypothetical protein
MLRQSHNEFVSLVKAKSDKKSSQISASKLVWRSFRNRRAAMGPLTAWRQAQSGPPTGRSPERPADFWRTCASFFHAFGALSRLVFSSPWLQRRWFQPILNSNSTNTKPDAQHYFGQSRKHRRRIARADGYSDRIGISLLHNRVLQRSCGTSDLCQQHQSAGRPACLCLDRRRCGQPGRLQPHARRREFVA